MPAKKGAKRAVRRAQKLDNYRKREPLQVDGQPQGKHLSGFKGTKVNAECFCGGCHPNARLGKSKVVYG